MNKKYIVRLTEDERSQLRSLITTGKRSVKIIKRAQILLKCDVSNPDCNWSDEHISQAFDLSTKSIGRLRQSLVLNGFDFALYQGQKRKPHRPKIDGEQEAHLIALACGVPPVGRKRWTLHLLADRMVELEYIDSVSHETVRQTLKKTN